MGCEVYSETTWIVCIGGSEYAPAVVDRDSFGLDGGVESLEVAVEEERIQCAWWSGGLAEGGEACGGCFG